MFSCIFNLCDVHMRIALTCRPLLCPGATSGVILKQVGFWGYFYEGEVGKGRVKAAPWDDINFRF